MWHTRNPIQLEETYKHWLVAFLHLVEEMSYEQTDGVSHSGWIIHDLDHQGSWAIDLYGDEICTMHSKYYL